MFMGLVGSEMCIRDRRYTVVPGAFRCLAYVPARLVLQAGGYTILSVQDIAPLVSADQSTLTVANTCADAHHYTTLDGLKHPPDVGKNPSHLDSSHWTTTAQRRRASGSTSASARLGHPPIQPIGTPRHQGPGHLVLSRQEQWLHAAIDASNLGLRQCALGLSLIHI